MITFAKFVLTFVNLIMIELVSFIASDSETKGEFVGMIVLTFIFLMNMIFVWI